MKRVVLYTKPGCHLCEAVAQVIDKARRKHPFEYVAINIEADPADFERYKHDIPVVSVDGVEIARHRLTAAELVLALG